MEWFYANENDEQIPIEENDLEKLTRNGVIKPKTLVWNESLPDWLECQKVKPELFRGQPSATTPPISDDAGATSSISRPLNFPVVAPGEPPPMDMRRVQGPADGLAVASMVCGIIGLLVSICSYGFGFPVSIAAVITGHVGRKKLREAGLPVTNGQLTAGLVMGWIGIGLAALILIGVIIYFVFVVGMVGAAAMEGAQ